MFFMTAGQEDGLKVSNLPAPTIFYIPTLMQAVLLFGVSSILSCFVECRSVLQEQSKQLQQSKANHWGSLLLFLRDGAWHFVEITYDMVYSIFSLVVFKKEL